MEKIPTDYFAVVKWWTSLKTQDKLLVYMLSVIIVVSTVCFRQSSTNETLQRENLRAIVECEQRVASAEKSERRRNDSVNSVKENKEELKRQGVLLQRTPEMKEQIIKIEKALK